MGYMDSVDKVVKTYFRAVTKEPLEYKGDVIKPQPLRVSEGVFRGYTCPAGCGACCQKYTMDWLPDEPRPEHAPVVERIISLNGREVKLMSDLQTGNVGFYCHHLVQETGRCGIHKLHPFSCDFELIRLSLTAKNRPNQMTTRLFGRGWLMKHSTDGERGAMCTITPPSAESHQDVVRKLKRLRDWVRHFGFKSCIDELVDWAESGPHIHPGFFNQEFKEKKPRVMLDSGV